MHCSPSFVQMSDAYVPLLVHRSCSRPECERCQRWARPEQEPFCETGDQLGAQALGSARGSELLANTGANWRVGDAGDCSNRLFLPEYCWIFGVDLEHRAMACSNGRKQKLSGE
jgi:hypothetical protein